MTSPLNGGFGNGGNRDTFKWQFWWGNIYLTDFRDFRDFRQRHGVLYERFPNLPEIYGTHIPKLFWKMRIWSISVSGLYLSKHHRGEWGSAWYSLVKGWWWRKYEQPCSKTISQSGHITGTLWLKRCKKCPGPGLAIPVSHWWCVLLGGIWMWNPHIVSDLSIYITHICK